MIPPLVVCCLFLQSGVQSRKTLKKRIFRSKNVMWIFNLDHVPARHTLLTTVYWFLLMLRLTQLGSWVTHHLSEIQVLETNEGNSTERNNSERVRQKKTDVTYFFSAVKSRIRWPRRPFSPTPPSVTLSSFCSFTFKKNLNFRQHELSFLLVWYVFYYER